MSRLVSPTFTMTMSSTGQQNTLTFFAKTLCVVRISADGILQKFYGR